MLELQQLVEWDKELLLTLNNNSSHFWDGFMWIFTSTVIWIPLALTLLYVILRNNNKKEFLLILCSLALVIFLCDRISSGVFKPYFQRFRPTRDPEIMYLVDIIKDYRGGMYGFLSSHAANTFGIFTFVAFLLRNKQISFAILFWALLTCYSRIYLGVHYLGDIIGGSILGIICGSLGYLFYKWIKHKYFPYKKTYLSPRYTSTGYFISDINRMITVLFSTYFVIIIIGMLVCKSNYF